MKYTIIVLISFSLLLTSCSSNQVTLTMRDGAKIESELLSVRDSSIIIQEKGGAPIAIRNEDVDYISYDAGSSIYYSIGTGILFGGLGVFVGTYNYNGHEFTPPRVVSGAAIGVALGLVVGSAIAPSDKLFHIDIPKEKEVLRTYSKYLSHEETDELKKIK